MTIEDFLQMFYTGRSHRVNAFLNAANSGDVTLVNDLAFLAAVHAWRNGSHGKKNASQIHITFCPRVRGGGTPNPFAISTAAIQPMTPGLKAVNDSIMEFRAMGGALHKSKELDKKIAAAKKSGGFGSIQAAFFGAYKKCTAGSRRISADLFDPATAEVEAPGGHIDQWLQGGGSINFPYSLNSNAAGLSRHFAEIRRLLSQGLAGGHLDLTDTGLDAI